MQPERTYPVLSRVCIGVGIAFLAISAFGNWRFGWSLSTDPIDRWWLAIIYSGSDVAAGVLVATGATMLRHPGWSWKAGGIAALIPAFVLVALSVLSTFGMMSSRIAVLAGQKAALSVDEGRLKWLRGQTLNQELPKSERRAFRVEEREAAKKTREAASVVTDNQAVAITNAAALAGIKLTTEQTQVGLTFVSSTMPMTIKFVCLGLGFFLFGAQTSNAAGSAEVNHRTKDGSDGSGGSGKPDLKVVQGEPKAEPPTEPAKKRAEPAKQRRAFSYIPATGAPERLSAFDRAYEAYHANPNLSTRELARKAGASQSTAQRVKVKQMGKINSIVRKYGNGGGFRIPAYN